MVPLFRAWWVLPLEVSKGWGNEEVKTSNLRGVASCVHPLSGVASCVHPLGVYFCLNRNTSNLLQCLTCS